MMRNWKLPGLSTLVAVAVAVAAPVRAGDTDGKLPPVDPVRKVEQRLDELSQKISDQFKDMAEKLYGEFKKISEVTAKQDKRLAALETNDADTRLKLSDVQIKLGTLERQLSDVRAELEALRKQGAGRDTSFYGPTEKAMEEIRARLGQIEQKLSGLPPQVTRSAPPPTGTGRVVLVNSYPADVLFLVNGRSYRVAPGASATLSNLPAGVVNYEVIVAGYGTVRRNAPVLAAGETLTITAR